ncbi:malonate transporter subunit MadL [bacterium]|nr:malonate transporter subunit MadL [Rubripirellula sp.]MDB4338655.1 malonate transporter subunit MadL [Rubripirellula sp.]MDC0279050.1 malonate transporter subunit MadL [bacterium]
MAIYGTALLSICLICGLLIGKLLGLILGIDANVGGVGIAMLMLILVSTRLEDRGLLPKPTQNGVLFWSSIYIPIVVAMSASQNVVAAMSGGTLAIITGTVVVLVCFALVPLISRIGRGNSETIGDES